MFFLLFPVGTSEPVQRRAWVTYLLVLANVVVYFAFNVRILVQMGPYNLEHFLETWGYVPDRPSLETALASLFLHGGLLHLISNMWPLLLFGRIVEDRLGHIVFAVLYVASGLAGVWLHDAMSIDIDREMALVGASGAISGVMGGLLVVALWAEFRFFYFYFVIIRFGAGITILISPWICLFFTGLDFLRGYINYLEFQAGRPSGGGVAVFAHIAGFCIGLALATLVWHLLPRLKRRPSLATLFDEGPKSRGPTAWLHGPDKRRNPQQREVDAILRLLERGHANSAISRYEKAVAAYPDIIFPPAQMIEMAEVLIEDDRQALAWGVCDRIVASVGSGTERFQALLMMGRLALTSRARQGEGLRRVRELLALDPEPAMRREAERLMMRLANGESTAEPQAVKSETSSLAQRLHAQAEGRPAAAYFPEPVKVTQTREESSAPSPWAPPDLLPPHRPAYTPDANAIEESRVFATHAVILVGRKPLDVPRVAQVVARAMGRSVVKVAEEITHGLGIILETDNFAVANSVTLQLQAQHFDTACVDLSPMPVDWDLSEFLAASVEHDDLLLAGDGDEIERIALCDLMTIAHASVPRMVADPDPPLVCDLLLRSRPRRLRAHAGCFTHGTHGEAPTLRAFALLLGQRAAGAERDAGILNTLATHQDSCMRFGSMEQFERYQRWLALCALAKH